MRIAVTGGAGFLGSHLCNRLLDDGEEVVCVDNLLTGRAANIAHLYDHPRFQFIHADVTEKTVEGVEALDSVLHFASPASPLDYQRYPLETLRAGALGTLHVLELARRRSARFVLASTSEVYGDPKVHPQTEDYWGNVNPIGPRSMYDEAKRYAEALVTAYRSTNHMNTGIIRIFNTYGPRMRPNDGRAIPTFISQALVGAPVTVAGNGQQTRSVCYVDDLVEGVVRMMRSSVPGPVNLGNPQETTILDLARTIIELCGSAAPITFIPPAGDDPLIRRPDISRARADLDWSPQVDLHRGLLQTIDWFRAELTTTGGAPSTMLTGDVPAQPRPGQQPSPMDVAEQPFTQQ